MTMWDKRFEDDPIHAKLQELQTLLSEAEKKGEGKEPVASAVERLRHITGFAERTLSQVDPLLASSVSLNGATKNLTNATNQVTQFIGTGDPDHLTNANNNAEGAIPHLSALVLPHSQEDVEGIRPVIAAFTKSTEEQVEAVGASSKQQVEELRTTTEEGKSSVAALKTQVQQLEQTINQEKSRIDQAVAQHQQHFSEQQDARQKSFTDAEKVRAEESSAALSSTIEKFSRLEAQQVERFDTLHSVRDTNMQAVADALEEKSTALLAELESKKAKAADIVGIIAGTGMAGGYQRDANEERKSFFRWNIGVGVGFVGLIGFAIWFFVETTRQNVEISFSQLGARTLLFLAFGLFATYAGRMAMKHRESEREHRYKQLALESVNAFLEDLEPEVQKTVKEKMAHAFFTQLPPARAESGDDVTPDNIQGLLKLVKAIEKLTK